VWQARRAGWRAWMRTGAEAALAALLPADCRLCGEPLPWRQRGGVCLPCWGRLPWTPGLRLQGGPLAAIVWAAEYRGPFRSLVRTVKFGGADDLAPPLGAAAAEALAPLLGALPPIDLVVPVPLHWWRRWRRGFNQAALLAHPLADRIDRPCPRHLLLRPRPGRRQLGLTRHERLRSLRGCFRAVARGGPRHTLRGAVVLLVDDVVTTGATLGACATALRAAGAARVYGCAVARTARGRAAEKDGSIRD
jgi:ComF family protein